MGLLDNSSLILVDAVLTAAGRAALARNDGSFEVVKFAFGDDEIDYSLFVVNTGSLQQDVNLLNTPVFEANVNEKIGLKYQLMTISNPNLQYLPSLNANVSALSLGEKNDSQIGQAAGFNQNMLNGLTVPSEIVDGSFIIQVNNSLLYIVNQTPASITPNGTAQYIIPRTAIASNQGAQVSFNIAVQALTNDVWSTLGSGTKGSRTITTTVRGQGA
jgi:hypothetical protein